MSDEKFWDGKPVGTGKENSPITMNIVAYLKPREIPENYSLCNIESDKEINDIITLIKNDYISTPSGSIRLEYPDDFIKWYIFDNNEIKNDSVLLKYKNELIGFVHSKIITLSVNTKILPVLGINFLCVKKEHRKMGFAKLLIEEITKKGLTRGLQVGVFTGSKELSFKFNLAKFYHRPINLTKLIDIGYLSKKLYFSKCDFFNINQKERFGIRRMEINDLKMVNDLIRNNNFKTQEVFSISELENYFLSNNKIHSYVYETKKTKEFFSFYEVTTIYKMKHSIKTAYLYYWSSNDPNSMIRDCIQICRKEGFDLMNVLNLGNNHLFLGGNGFLPGTGIVNYYFYNFKCEEYESKENNFIMF